MTEQIHVPHIPEKDIRIAFIVSLVLKAINAAVQTLLGLLLLFTTGLSDLFVNLIQNELLEDPDSFLAGHLSNFANHLSVGSQLYAAIYLLSHGIVKIFLVWGLIKNKLWAYPASIAVFSLFILYQIVSIARSFSIFFLLLTIFDLLVIWLIVHEYRVLKKRRHITA